ncbi:hypothetical protein D3C85_1783570 [compost metagenome]
MAAPETERGVHAQETLRRCLGNAEKLLHAVDLCEDPPGMLQIHLAFVCETHAPRRTVDQQDADS